MRCKECGHDNGSDAAFCGGCGRRVAGPAGAHRYIAGAPISAEDSNSEATRYACAAVHTDAMLARRIVEQVVDEDLRALPTSPGFDLAVVVRHALDARQRQILRDVLLSALVFVGVVALMTSRVGWLLLALLAAWMVIFGDALLTTYGVLASRLSLESFSGRAAPVPMSAKTRRRLEQIEAAQDGNVTVTGAFSPFAGSGTVLQSWSVAVDTEKPGPGQVKRPFGVNDLNDRIRNGLRDLAWTGVDVSERVFVDGRDVAQDRRFLPDPLNSPLACVDPQVLERLRSDPDDRARPYVVARVVGWQGELVMSVFIRTVLVQRSLFIEASYGLLTPVHGAYKAVDELVRVPHPRVIGRVAGRSLARVLAAPLLAVQSTLAESTRPIRVARRVRRQRRDIRLGRAFNYGPQISVREAVSDPKFQRYFQVLDRDMYLKVIERRLLDSIITFLDEHGIDTGDLVERQTTILNQGVWVAGGRIEAQSLAVGKQARATAGAAKRAASNLSRSA